MRLARVVVPNIPHHITQRGNNREDIFFDESDWHHYLSWLKEYSKRYGLEVWAYCLMSNHIDLIACPKESHSLSRTLRDAHMRYAQYVNRRYKRSGHLWQGRFFSCALEESHLLMAVRYVERNPVRVGIVSEAWEYPWSSAQTHVNGSGDIILEGDNLLRDMVNQWEEFLQEEDDPKKIGYLRRNTKVGRPVGSESFVKRIEGLLLRVIRPKKTGRPRK